MAFNWFLTLRVAQVLLALTLFGLSYQVIHWGDDFWHDPTSQVDFLFFSSIWTLLALAYALIAPWKFPRAWHPVAILVVELLTVLFWFGGFVAWAVYLDTDYCWGDVCIVSRAAEAAAALLWLTYIPTSIFAAVHVSHTRKTRAVLRSQQMSYDKRYATQAV